MLCYTYTYAAGGHPEHTQRTLNEPEMTASQRRFFTVLAYAVRAIDYGTVALKLLWLPTVIYIGSSSRFGGEQSIDWKAKLFGDPNQQQQQPQYY